MPIVRSHFLHIGISLILAFGPIVSDAKTHRSYTAKAEFKRQQPCPANGATRGPCPGYQIDHAKPLKCGGIDAPSNMQWLTIEEHRTKTSREAAWCRSHPSN